MTTGTKIRLSPEQETLLITLYARAQPDNALFYDPMSADLLRRLDYDFSRLKVPFKTVLLVCQRAMKLDQVTRDFLAAYPAGVVVQVGSGLDNRFWRVDNGQVTWYDLDMDPVVELRRELFPVHPRNHLVASSVTDLEWMDAVAPDGKPVLVVAEGLLMYLSPTEVQRLVVGLSERFPGARLIADVFSTLAARSATQHPSLKQTGAHIGWGMDDSREPESWAPTVRLLEEFFFSQDPHLERVSTGYRLVYRLAGAFKAARMAHRVVYYQL